MLKFTLRHLQILKLNFSVNSVKIFLSTSKRDFPSYQGKSTIFDKGNFLS